MALEEFEKEPLSNRDKNLIRMRSLTNYVMGIFFIGVGFFFMFPNKYSADFINRYDADLMKMFAVICWIYGVFRMFRGYSKNYFKDR